MAHALGIEEDNPFDALDVERMEVKPVALRVDGLTAVGVYSYVEQDGEPGIAVQWCIHVPAATTNAALYVIEDSGDVVCVANVQVGEVMLPKGSEDVVVEINLDEMFRPLWKQGIEDGDLLILLAIYYQYDADLLEVLADLESAEDESDLYGLVEQARDDPHADLRLYLLDRVAVEDAIEWLP